MDTPTRRYLTTCAASHRSYWSWALDEYARLTDDTRPPWDALACARGQWDDLALYLLPRPDHFAADIATTAASLGLDAGRLAANPSVPDRPAGR